MKRFIAAVARFVHACDGQDLVEYGVLAALISCFVIGAVTFFGQTITNTFWNQVVQLAQNL
jgi:Flp pilus assembly pilin Flp